MKISFTPNVITNNEFKHNKNSNKKSTQITYTSQINSQKINFYTYQDYNINFTGRTPENFYAQDFNRENMPDSMKEYLNYDYEQRRHIPPEQMMGEVFKYIKIADNFDDVKSIYPNEQLFKSLHKNNQNNRSSILWETKVAKQLSDKPLFKDGSDDFGMYLLRKIYLEGKTIKEINKDFYEKDINDSYRGIITKQIDSQTTSAFGIRYPKSAFWNSFIATREEYKNFFVTLPKNSTNPAVKIQNTNTQTTTINNLDNQNSNNKSVQKTRKYQIKNYQKKLLTGDIKESKADTQEIEKRIRRRFGKDDPEASFIVKYLSPIMAVAAERVHLSEEMKSFCEMENKKGKTSDDEFMFKRFWKHNPNLLNYYAETITDTIDMFEEIYAEGGLIPINKDLEVITANTENKSAIDNVNSEFVELLDYTQTITPEREKRYELHKNLQKDWDEHFITRYGAIPQAPLADSIEENSPSADIKEKPLTTNINKLYIQSLKIQSDIYPSEYSAKYINYMKNNKNIDDDYKAAYSYYVGNNDIDANSLKLSQDEFYDKFTKLEQDFVLNNEKDSIIAKLAIMDVLAENDYRDYKIYTLNTFDLQNINKDKTLIYSIIKNNKQRLNQIYTNYKTPIKPNEAKKIVNELFKQLQNYTPQKQVAQENLSEILLMLKKGTQSEPRAQLLKYILEKAVISSIPYAKIILNQNDTIEEKTVKFENIMYYPIDILLNNDSINLLQIIGAEALQKNINNLDEQVKIALISKISKMNANEMAFFEFTHAEYTNELNKNPEMCKQKYSFVLK